MQKQIYLHFAEAKYLRRSQNTKKPGQTQPESDFIQAKSKIVKGERKRELVPCFPRRILSKTMSKIGKEERNRAGLHAQIAEPHPIFCKDTDKRGQSAPIRILPNESILGFVQDANEPNAKANKFVFCRNKISTTKLKIRKAASPYGNKRRRDAVPRSRTKAPVQVLRESGGAICPRQKDFRDKARRRKIRYSRLPSIFSLAAISSPQRAPCHNRAPA